MHAQTHTPDTPPTPTDPERVEAFLDRWLNNNGTERSNWQMFLLELCTLLDLPQPNPSSNDPQQNDYIFERRVHIPQADGSIRQGSLDLYRRGFFVIEAKQSKKAQDSKGHEKSMEGARNQADTYIRALPADEGRPPFLIVIDVGQCIELYAEFSRTGGNYLPYPDPAHHRIPLSRLREPQIQHLIHTLWHNPDALDTSKHAAQVTQEVSNTLAQLARDLEQSGYPVDRVAHFLKRCLFTMFSEDVELLPKGSYTQLLQDLQKTPEHFADAMRALWTTMDNGGYEGQLRSKLPRFNGNLFKNLDPIPLNAAQIDLLIRAARADWRYVEPAIFGTLLERALDPKERHKLGAHYTPRTYVERLVIPTLIRLTPSKRKGGLKAQRLIAATSDTYRAEILGLG